MMVYPGAPAPVRGVRPLSARSLATTAQADSFMGLPRGVTRWRLAAALRAAARLLDLSAPMLRLLEHYIDCTFDVDWTAGSEPVIIRPLTEVAICLDRSERQIRNLERALAERGLLAWRDSGNHHRRGQRDRRTGRLLHAYGPSLAPLAARADEIIALAAQARHELSDLRRARMAIGALRRRLRCALPMVPETGDTAGHRCRAARMLSCRLPARLSLAELETHRDDLRLLVIETEALTAGYSEAGEGDPAAKGEISGRHYTDTIEDKPINGYQTRKQERIVMSHDNERTATRLSLDMIMRAAGPTLKELMGTGCSNPDLIRAAEQTAILLGIQPSLWAEGCGRMGRIQTSLTILVMEQAALRTADHNHAPLRHPPAYFRALMNRHENGTLHIDRSIRWLTQQPKAAPSNAPVNSRTSTGAHGFAECSRKLGRAAWLPAEANQTSDSPPTSEKPTMDPLPRPPRTPEASPLPIPERSEQTARHVW